MKKILKIFIWLIFVSVLSCSVKKDITASEKELVNNTSRTELTGVFDCEKRESSFKNDDEIINLTFSIEFCDLFEPELSQNQYVLINLIMSKENNFEPSMLYYEIYSKIDKSLVEKNSVDFNSIPFGLNFNEYQTTRNYKISQLKLTFDFDDYIRKLKNDLNLTFIIK